MEEKIKFPSILKFFKYTGCFHAFTNAVSSQTSCTNASFLPYAHQEVLYSGYANVIAKLQNLLVELWDLYFQERKITYWQRGLWENSTYPCDWLQACPLTSQLSLKHSTETQVPKVSNPSPNQGHSMQPPFFSDPEIHFFCMKSLNLTTLLPQYFSSTHLLSQKMFFFSRKIHQILLSPGCTPEPLAFLC